MTLNVHASQWACRLMDKPLPFEGRYCRFESGQARDATCGTMSHKAYIFLRTTTHFFSRALLHVLFCTARGRRMGVGTNTHTHIYTSQTTTLHFSFFWSWCRRQNVFGTGCGPKQNLRQLLILADLIRGAGLLCVALR